MVTRQSSNRFQGFSLSPPTLPNRVQSRFSAEDRKVTLRNIRMVAILAAFLVPFFAIVDYFAYPEHFGLFLVFRASCTVLVLLIWNLSQLPLGKRYYRVFTVILPMIPAFFIALMIGFSRDPGSPYYAGLSLCLVAIGFVFHWTYREAFISSLLVLVMYLLACLPGVWHGTSEGALFAFINNLIFIFATGVVISSGSFAHHRIRIREFLARDELRQSQKALESKNIELRSILKELGETERQLIQSEKMASLGELSAGVIHEIGNPLNFSNQALFLMRKKIKRSDLGGLNDIVSDMQEGVDRIKDIVADLREFSHKGDQKSHSFKVEESIHSALRLLGKQIETNRIAVTVEMHASPEALGVKNQITQVIMNLVQNAIHAIEESNSSTGGRVNIEVFSEMDTVRIEITDSGPGISSENRTKLFDPFFTTKEPGKGTGLGLSICYRIIESHKGSLEVDSSPGEFTCFTIKLPKYQKAAIKQRQRIA